jgi:hypothetical protein
VGHLVTPLYYNPEIQREIEQSSKMVVKKQLARKHLGGDR